ncbi:MAG: hypothetical protein CMD92_10200 [Gammaproteobacteria bacterium]|nr:hypothetical protein [Gammaproteobacteria bacterium]HBW84168.1 hypothetical protein [Gammaproteobacteria bacterium]|tara:strand:+ start:2129 stop:2326 length:198 start_codon:yes stop_codon:yes gene_type:complete
MTAKLNIQTHMLVQVKNGIDQSALAIAFEEFSEKLTDWKVDYWPISAEFFLIGFVSFTCRIHHVA